MAFRKPLQHRILMVAGLAGLALYNVLRYVADRSGEAAGSTDFALGMLFGVSAGLLLIFIWRNGRRLGRTC